jgi:hypothetical protein
MGSGAADSPAKVESAALVLQPRPAGHNPRKKPLPAGIGNQPPPRAKTFVTDRRGRLRLIGAAWQSASGFKISCSPMFRPCRAAARPMRTGPTSYEVEGDHYVAIITDERPDGPLARAHIDVGTRIIVPNAKIKWDQGNPTGHGVIFLRSDDKWVYCYAPPGGV